MRIDCLSPNDLRASDCRQLGLVSQVHFLKMAIERLLHESPVFL
jgi:hypothetical protein